MSTGYYISSAYEMDGQEQPGVECIKASESVMGTLEESGGTEEPGDKMQGPGSIPLPVQKMQINSLEVVHEGTSMVTRKGKWKRWARDEMKVENTGQPPYLNAKRDLIAVGSEDTSSGKRV
ncbi:hypothetical protein ACOSQ3_031444 [Xanthoceras sorbifolium]